MNSKKIFILLICLGAPLVIGFLGSYFTLPAIGNWYLYLQKPLIAPPNWVFGPVWTTLYLMMGLASYLVFQKGVKKKNIQALKLYALQLCLNLLWSIVFFGFQSIIGGLVVIISLWLVILLTIKEFTQLNKIAGKLLWPYIGWVTFASILNFLIFTLNR